MELKGGVRGGGGGGLKDLFSHFFYAFLSCSRSQVIYDNDKNKRRIEFNTNSIVAR